MIEDYRKRKQKFTIDGAPIFTTDEDYANERSVAEKLEAAWDCKLHHLGIYSSVDWWAERHGQPVGWVEIKSRAYRPYEHHSTIMLNIRKWLALTLLNATTDLPAIFVSHIGDKIRWIPISQVEASSGNIKIIQPKGGIVKSRNDREPCVMVSLALMKELET
jgi:hypothetical protein